jgi:hypothetical protein
VFRWTKTVAFPLNTRFWDPVQDRYMFARGIRIHPGEESQSSVDCGLSRSMFPGETTGPLACVFSPVQPVHTSQQVRNPSCSEPTQPEGPFSILLAWRDGFFGLVRVSENATT